MTPSPKRKLKWSRIVLLSFLIASIVMFGTGAGLILGLLRELPSFDQVGQIRPDMSSIIYDKDRLPIQSLHGTENRELVELKRIPKFLQQAFIATEDQQFYEHFGVNPKAIMRAAWVIASGRGFQGGSTITQQLAKNAFLTQDQTLKRKIQEAWFAIQLERRYTKDEIMQFYLNQIFFGHNYYGVQTASRAYFGKDVDKINLAEAAMLAGITKWPSAYNPIESLEKAKARQATVLNLMAQQGYITAEEAKAAKETKIVLPASTKSQGAAQLGGYFVDYVLEQLIATYGEEKVYKGGLKVYTTMDRAAQKAAEDALTMLDKDFPIQKDKPSMEAAAVYLEARTGYIRAIVGGRTHKGRLVKNRATELRQPGSTFKPIAVYSTALENGFTPGTVIDDAPFMTVSGKTWPENWDFKFGGLTTLRNGLMFSVNTVAVKVLQKIGTEKGFEAAKRFGFTTLVDGGPRSDRGNLAFGLGGLTEGVSPVELTAAFSAFANNGNRAKPVSILKVVDANGKILEENKPALTKVLSPQVAYLMVDMMKGVITGATGRLAHPGRPAAGKTGTTDQFKDAWFVGFTPDLVGTVWIGYDDRRPNQEVFGGFWPARIWKQTVVEMSKNIPANDWPVPPGLTRVSIDTKSGKLPSQFTPKETIREELFIAGTEPKDLDDIHVPVMVCLHDDKLLHSPNCAGTCIPVTKVFIKRAEPWKPTPDGRGPADAKDEVPTKYCDQHSGPFNPDPRFVPPLGPGQPERPPSGPLPPPFPPQGPGPTPPGN